AGDPASEPIDGWTKWHVVTRDNSARIAQLEKRTGRPFPPSFQYLLANYSFPAFAFGPLMFFANTGEDRFWELGKRLFSRQAHVTAPADAKSGIRFSTTTIQSALTPRARESKSESFSWITKRFFSTAKSESSKRLRLLF